MDRRRGQLSYSARWTFQCQSREHGLVIHAGQQLAQAVGILAQRGHGHRLRRVFASPAERVEVDRAFIDELGQPLVCGVSYLRRRVRTCTLRWVREPGKHPKGIADRQHANRGDPQVHVSAA